MQDKWYKIALDSDRPLAERAEAIGEDMASTMKKSGTIAGLGMITLFEEHKDVFKERFGDNWSPALKEFVRRYDPRNIQDMTEEEKEEAKEEIIAELEQEFLKLPFHVATHAKSIITQHDTEISFENQREADHPNTRARRVLFNNPRRRISADYLDYYY